MSDLDRWLEKIRTGRGGWVEVYMEALACPISDPDRFFKALEVYGIDHMFEAIIITSTKKVKNDPLNYILAVAHSQAQEEVLLERKGNVYLLELERSKAITETDNKDLAERMRRAKELVIE